jgi:hypothetical protein
MSFLSRLLGKSCAHYFSWPRTDSEGRYYQICSRCGVAYEYDWGAMRRTDRRVAQITANPEQPPVVGKGEVAVRLPLVR